VMRGAPATAAAPRITGLPPGTRAKRIAVALEIGPADANVIEYVLAMERDPDAEVILLHVAESAASRYLGPESSDAESREDRDALESIAAGLRARGLKTRVLLGYGDVMTELARLVGESGADLLVTGSHGHRLLGDLVLGSTATGVRHRVHCAVLTVPPSPHKHG
ncbi:MAG: universal stress protein, partial [Candidatus Eisenbacteria bacterium]|nr:universal stress protein [Candidatus Eisenbacteria bacterium]